MTPGGYPEILSGGKHLQRAYNWDHMSVRSNVTGIDRIIALLLAFIWSCAGIAGIVLASVGGRWLLTLPALFALCYAMLWLRVFARARLVS